MSERPALAILPYLVLPDIFLTCLLKCSAFLAYAGITVKALGATTRDGLQDYSMGSMFMGQLLTATYLIFLADPLRNFRYRNDATEPVVMPFYKRVHWALCINHAPRGIGWNWQVANVPPPPRGPCWVFVRRQLFRAARCFLLLNFAQSYIHLNPLFTCFGVDAQYITAQGYVW
ncbi:hypothetical protein OBBRIDRAFT_807362 [Obba rivulosa]|uniref:Uncharacterized protein n=1 Tax=Obba rivulosa TaxID=1052685 RepID=A0A8E2AJD5_9APHY|nr:hypothetical protein OBBRIDRAFT_807362 [Obba rivulosa]